MKPRIGPHSEDFRMNKKKKKKKSQGGEMFYLMICMIPPWMLMFPSMSGLHCRFFYNLKHMAFLFSSNGQHELILGIEY